MDGQETCNSTVGNRSALSRLESDIDEAACLAREFRVLEQRLDELRCRIREVMGRSGVGSLVTSTGSRATLYGSTHVHWDGEYLVSVLSEEQLERARVRTPTTCLRIS